MGLTPEFKRFIGNQVRFWREDRLMSLEDFSKLAGLSDTTVFRLEKGHSVSARTMLKVLGVTGHKLPAMSETFGRHRQLALNMPEKS